MNNINHFYKFYIYILILNLSFCLIPNYSIINIKKINNDSDLVSIFISDKIEEMGCDKSILNKIRDWDIYFIEKLKNKLVNSGYIITSDPNKSDLKIKLYISKCNTFCEFCKEKSSSIFKVNNIKKFISFITLGIIPVVIQEDSFHLLLQIEESKLKKIYRFPLEIRNQYFISIFYFPFVLLESNKLRFNENLNFYIDKVIIYINDRNFIYIDRSI